MEIDSPEKAGNFVYMKIIGIVDFFGEFIVHHPEMDLPSTF